MNNLYDDNNARIYRQYGLSDSRKVLYTCTECGRKLSLSDSYSSRGRSLVCFACFNDKFNGDIEKLHRSISEDLKYCTECADGTPCPYGLESCVDCED